MKQHTKIRRCKECGRIIIKYPKRRVCRDCLNTQARADWDENIKNGFILTDKPNYFNSSYFPGDTLKGIIMKFPYLNGWENLSPARHFDELKERFA